MRSIRSALVRFRICLVTGVGLLALVAVGCGGRGNMSGKVTYQDKPVVFGTVLIQGSDGNSHQGNIEKDGTFTVHGVAAGEVRAAVNSPNPRSITLITKDPNKKREGFPDAPGWVAIPKQFGNVDTSGLKYTIRGGSNMINIELK